MVIAKTPTTYTYLTHLFERGEVTKEYEAIVYGIVSQPDVTLTFPLARSKTKGWKIAARPSQRSGYSVQGTDFDEREAITHIVRIGALSHYTHLRILPTTGRMHQIRVHCAAFGHPIVGDTLYAGKTLHPEREARLYLHATQLRFTDPKGNERVFSSPLPETFAHFLNEHA
jgi:23S rRNA-/tRNA-specific pseudouridylate synthase